MSNEPQLLKFRSVSTVADNKGDVMNPFIECKDMEAALVLAEMEEQHLKQDHIPGSLGVDLYPIDTYTKSVVNEKWLELLYKQKLYRDDDNA